MTQTLEAKQLSNIFKESSPHHSQMLGSALIEIDSREHSFLRQYRIYRCTYLNPHRPVVFYLGAASPDQTGYVLSGDAENFTRMFQEDGGSIEDETVISFVQTFLECTRDLAKLVYFPATVHELRFVPGTNPDKTGLIKLDLTDMITPPRKSPLGKGFIVFVNKVVNQDVYLMTVTVTANGGIFYKEDMLASGLPLVQGI